VPIEVSPLYRNVFRDDVAGIIVRALVSGELKPGDRIVEADLARKANISRGPVREAVQQLVGEGLLVSIPHRGTFVARWTERDVVETYRLRALLEAHAARLAAERMTPSELRALEGIVDELVLQAQDGNLAAVPELDFRFHLCLYEASGNRLLRGTIEKLWGRISMFVGIDAYTTDNLIHYAQNHRMLLDILKTGDPDTVERVFRQHYAEVSGALVQRLKEKHRLAEEDERVPPGERNNMTTKAAL